jgi:hypothetical protein
MVYRGPSKGCLPCRQRKIRCDLNKPQCNNCRKRSVACPGPRVGKDEIEFTAVYATSKASQYKASQHAHKQTFWPGRGNSCRTTCPPSHANAPLDGSCSHSTSAVKSMCLCPVGSYPSPPDSSDASSNDESLSVDPPSLSVSRSPPGGQYLNLAIGSHVFTPTLIALLDFWRRVALHNATPNDSTDSSAFSSSLAPRTPPTPLNGLSNLPHRAYLLSILSLHAPFVSHAFLAVVSAYYISLLPSHSEIRVFHQRARLDAVRTARLQLETQELSEHTVSNLSVVLAGELVIGDWDACVQHMKFLAGVVQGKPEGGKKLKLKDATRHSVLHMDIERATAMGTRSYIDLDGYDCGFAALEAWEQDNVLSGSLSAPSWSKPLDADALACSPDLTGLLSQVRHLISLMSHPEARPGLPRLVTFQLSTSLDIVAGKLLACYCDNAERLHKLDQLQQLSSSPPTKHHQDRVLTSTHAAAACLAAVYYLRTVTRQEWIGSDAEHGEGAPRAEAEGHFIMERFCAQARRIYPRLVNALEQSELALQEGVLGDWDRVAASGTTAQVEASNLPPEVRLRLWVLHVGGVIERTADFGPRAGHGADGNFGRVAVRPAWCRQRLRELVTRLRLGGEELKEVLAGFLPLLYVKDGLEGVDRLEDMLDCKLSADVYGPRWMSPVLRTWGLTDIEGSEG